MVTLPTFTGRVLRRLIVVSNTGSVVVVLGLEIVCITYLFLLAVTGLYFTAIVEVNGR
jgi:hypothetical protein